MSEQPPPFQLPYQAPMRRTNRTLWIIAACILIPCCGLLIGGGLYIWKLFNEAIPFVGCVAAMDNVGTALDAYAKEHNGKLPPAATWQDEVAPYYAKLQTDGDLGQFIRMKPDEDWGCWDSDGKRITGFAFNPALSGRVIADIKEPEQNPVVFEVPEVKRNNNVAYFLREESKSPTLVFGTRRGWIELSPDGRTFTLIQKGGQPVRVPIELRGGSNFDMDEKSGIKVKVPAPNEPEK